MDNIRTDSTTAAELRQSYQAAFRDFSEKVRQVQHLTELIGTGSTGEALAADRLESAVLELERARMTYSHARNRLAETLGSQSSSGNRAETLTLPSAERVRNIANLLWEAGGRPHGTADHDWFRAERIIQVAHGQEDSTQDSDQLKEPAFA